MAKPLRLGIAGLGVVGSSLVQLLQRQGDGLAARAGSACAIAAYSARHKSRPRPELAGARFFENAATMAASADIDVFVELIGGADGVAFEAVKAALARGLPVVTANKAMLAAHGLGLATLSRGARRAALFRGGGRRRHPGHQDAARELGRQRDQARLRHPQRHLQLHPVADGDRQPAVRRLSRRGAAARLRRGGSDFRHRRLRHGAQARDSRLARLRLQDRRRGGVGRGHRVDHACRSRRRPTNSASASSCSASRNAPRTASSSACIRRWCRKRAPLAQTMGVLNAVSIDGDAVGELTLVGPGAGGDATASAVAADIVDIARGIAPAGVRPARRRAGRRRPRADAAPRGRLLRSPRGGRPAGGDGRDRQPDWANG